MRILFVTAFYPPHGIGGWDQWVVEINSRLQERGHSTHVLTSRYPHAEPRQEPGVDRVLNLEADQNHYDPRALSGYRRRLRENLLRTTDTIEKFKPDVVFVHNMWNLTRGVPWAAEQRCPRRVVYYVSDHWPYSPDPHINYWQDRPSNSLSAAAKRAIAPGALWWIRNCNRRFKLDFHRVLCVSRAIRDALLKRTDIEATNLRVVYNGVDTKRFSPSPGPVSIETNDLSLLFAGSLIWHKGADTAIEAMNVLRQSKQLNGIYLEIAGSGHPDHERELREMVQTHGLAQCVRFLGTVDGSSMPDLLRQHQVLVLPSKWDEPFSLVMQEAMATGMVVIGTPTGGTGELLVHGKNGLTFPAGSATALADGIMKLRRDPQLVTRLGGQAREAILENFSIQKAVDEIESNLEDCRVGQNS